MKTINKIITKVSTKYGAPMGRNNEGTYPPLITSGKSCKIYKCNQTKVFDCKIPLNSGGYDKGGVYWGIGSELRVQYTKDLKYINFYRK
jgi:hypothetical protein